MSRYGDNIRRIAETEDLTKRIVQSEQRLDQLEKSNIPGQRAIAYPSGGLQSGSPGVTNPDKNGEPDDKPPYVKDSTDDAGKDGKTTDGSDILDNKLQPGEDPGKISLKDCDTGETIDIILNAGANEGETKFQHPDGWTINGTAGNQDGYDDWTLGKYWTGTSLYFTGGSSDSPSPAIGYKDAIGYYNGTFDYSITDARIVSTIHTDATHITLNVEYYLVWNSLPINTGWVSNPQLWVQQDCMGETGTDRCITAIPPAYTSWQDQDPAYKHQLAFSTQDGGFVSSSKDSGLPSKFRNDVGSGLGLNNLHLCTIDDNTEVMMSALIDGSFAYFAEDGFGEPLTEDTKIFHFDKDGKYKDIIDKKQYKNLKSLNNPGA